MVANGLSSADVLDPSREVAFPESVVSLFKGELGFPPDGFPAALSRRILKCDTAAPILPEPPQPYRPGDTMPAVDLEAARAEAGRAVGRQLDDNDLASYLMYPKVFREFADYQRRFGDVSVIPTAPFFYGMGEREEVAIDIDAGKTLVIRMQGSAPSEEEGVVKMFFELNGQPRTMRIEKAGAKPAHRRAQADPANPAHVPAPMPGMVVTVAVRPGQPVRAGDPLVSIEAMKMESQIRAERDGTVRAVHVKSGDTVAARDLLIEFAAA